MVKAWLIVTAAFFRQLTSRTAPPAVFDATAVLNICCIASVIPLGVVALKK